MAAYEVMGMDDGFVSKDVILLVDADAQSRASMQTILHAAGYAVFSSPNAKAAVKLCTMIHFDLIVSRVILPVGGISGIPWATSTATSKVGILLMSYAERNLLEGIPKSVDYDFLPNPFTQEQLIGKVRQRLQQLV